MSISTTLLEILDEALLSSDKGIFVRAIPTSTSLRRLHQFFVPEHLPEISKDVHTTIMYSKEPFHKEIPDFSRKVPIHGIVTKVTHWEGADKSGFLVANLVSPDLVHHHNVWKDVGAKPTFPKYNPHITIKNPISKEEASKLMPKINKRLRESGGLGIEFYHAGVVPLSE